MKHLKKLISRVTKLPWEAWSVEGITPKMPRGDMYSICREDESGHKCVAATYGKGKDEGYCNQQFITLATNHFAEAVELLVNAEKNIYTDDKGDEIAERIHNLLTRIEAEAVEVLKEESDMGDMAKEFKAIRGADRERKEKNLNKANPSGWIKHNTYHWSRTLLGDRLDYWPSRNKWRWRGKIYVGYVVDFIKNRTRRSDMGYRLGFLWKITAVDECGGKTNEIFSTPTKDIQTVVSGWVESRRADGFGYLKSSDITAIKYYQTVQILEDDNEG